MHYGRKALAAGTAAALITALLVAAEPAGAADPRQALLDAAQPVRLGDVPAIDGKRVDVRKAAAGPQIIADSPADDAATQPLVVDASPVRTRPVPSVKPVDPNGPNVSKDRIVMPAATTPNIPLLNTDGTIQAEAGGVVPDPNAAVGSTQIVETTNLFLKVRSKFLGGVQCQVGLNSFLGTGDILTDPRTQFDTLNDRYVMVVTIQPTSPSAVPALWVAATAGSDACGGWFAYRVPFPMIINGLMLDFPNVGQDRNAIIVTTNNFSKSENRIVNASVFALSKFGIYTGSLPAFTVFGVNKNTAPSLVAGAPILSTAQTYLISATPLLGYLLYSVTDPGTPFMTVSLIQFIDAQYGNPSGLQAQCNSPFGINLSIEGGIDSAVIQTDQFLWFAHTALLGGFRTVVYGALRISDGALFTSLAFHSGTSEDFNPSIGVGIFGPNLFFVYLNWAYVDRGAVPCQNASATIATVLPNEGVPLVGGVDGTLASGGVVTSGSAFGDYSSVSIDPSPPGGCFAGSGVVTSQQYYDGSGQWRSRLGRFCIA